MNVHTESGTHQGIQHFKDDLNAIASVDENLGDDANETNLIVAYAFALLGFVKTV